MLAAIGVLVVILQLAVRYIPFLSGFFNVLPLSGIDLSIAAGAGAVVIAVNVGRVGLISGVHRSPLNMLRLRAISAIRVVSIRAHLQIVTPVISRMMSIVAALEPIALAAMCRQIGTTLLLITTAATSP